MKPRLKSGFTLVELLVVIVIIGILAALLLPQITAAIRNARITACASNLRSLWQSQVAWSAQNGGPHKTLPSTTGGAFWLRLQEGDRPMIGRPEIFFCPCLGDEMVPGSTSYRGPASNVNRMDDKDPVGACRHPGYAGNVLFRTGDVQGYPDDDPIWLEVERKTSPW